MDCAWKILFSLGLWVLSLLSSVACSVVVKMNEDFSGSSQWHNCTHAKQQIEVKIHVFKRDYTVNLGKSLMSKCQNSNILFYRISLGNPHLKSTIFYNLWM